MIGRDASDINIIYIVTEEVQSLIFFSMLTFLLSLTMLYLQFIQKQEPEFYQYFWFQWGLIFSTTGLLNRLINRIVSVIRVNGLSLEILQIPLRWPLGIWINIVASLRALNQFQRHLFFNEPLKWVKTTHVLPENFGIEVSQEN